MSKTKILPPKAGDLTDDEIAALPEISKGEAEQIMFGGPINTVHERFAEFYWIDPQSGWVYEVLIDQGKVVKAKTGQRQIRHRP